MLKILLLREAPEGAWGGARERVDTPTQLAGVADVSVAKAHRFYRTFEARNFLRRSPDGIKIVRKRNLIDAWLAEESLQYRWEVPVRFIYGKTDEVLQRLGSAHGHRFAVAGFEACRMHGVLHTTSPRISVFVSGAFESFLHMWEVEECQARDAHFVMVKPRFPESIFRGLVIRDHLPVVDVFQAALDVRPQKPRGAEQAAFIVDHIMNWDLNK